MELWDEGLIINSFVCWFLSPYHPSPQEHVSKLEKEIQEIFQQAAVTISRQLHLRSAFLPKIPSDQIIIAHKISMNVVLSFMYNYRVTSNLKYLQTHVLKYKYNPSYTG